MDLGTEPPGGMNMIKLPREDWGCGQVAYNQFKAFAREKAAAWHELGENCHLSTDLV